MIINTDDAFSMLVNSPYLWQKTGQNDQLRRWYMHRLKSGQKILLDTKIDYLTQAGFKIRTPLTWRSL